MAVRAREILLRWGCFSEHYINRAGFLESTEKTLNWSQIMLRLVCIGVVAPSLAILPLAFEVTSDPSEDEFVRTLWFGVTTGVLPTLIGAPFRNEFAQIPYGKHNILDLLALAIDHAFVSCTFMCLNASLSLSSYLSQTHTRPTVSLRMVFGISIIPFEFFCVVVLCIVVVNPIIFGTKWIPVKHPKTGENVRVNLGTVVDLPQQFYFDTMAQCNKKRVQKLSNQASGFALLYVQPQTSLLCVTFTALHLRTGTRFSQECFSTAVSSFKLF